MTRRAAEHLSRAALRAALGVLLVARPPPPAAPPAVGQPAAVPPNPAEGPEPLVAVWDDGSVTALHGHVDLGTGLRTALAQIVAEELECAVGDVEVALGDTTRAPNQGATIASASIQLHAEPLRRAAAQARAWLAHAQAAAPGSSHAALLGGRHIELTLDPAAPVKPVADYRIVGTSVPRVDLLGKATGAPVFVHDQRVPGMLHGRVVRPPYAGVDAGPFVGHTLDAVDERSIAHVPGIRAVVVIADFVGIVAEREEQAEAAMRALRVRWKPWPGMQPLGDLARALRANPATRRVLVERGDVDAAIAGAAMPLQREYVWPYQLHASIGPSCALADWQLDASGAARLTVWTGSQNPHVLRADLARLTGLADLSIDVIRLEAAGCYGRNGADDVSADAALLARAVGAPVRVQLTREQEHLWEPKGAAQLMQVDGGLDAHGGIAAYDFQTSYPSNGAPTLALLLTGAIEPDSAAYEMGDRTAVPPYAIDHLRVVANDMPPILRASWLRGVSALPNSFAHESYIDELATAAGVDPVEFRLRHLGDARAAELVTATAARAGWRSHTRPQQQPSEATAAGELLKGQGFAYARYVHSKFPGFGAAWAAWVADVEVNRRTGEVHVSRVVVGHDAGLMINPAGVRHQIHGNVLQTTSRALKESLRLDATMNIPAAREWGAYPILDFREVPVVEVMMMPRPGEPPLGAGESASVPGTAAIANAIFDATGVRFRAPPFTPELVRAALNALPAPATPFGGDGATAPARPDTRDAAPEGPAAMAQTSAAASASDSTRAARLDSNAPWPRRRAPWARAAALATGIVGIAAATLGWRPVIAPIAVSPLNVYTPELIERGRVLAAAGDCIVCHTAPGGAPNAGGRAMATAFGTVYSTNLTPDVATGIGAWSFSAFQRAMRAGVSRDGHFLYPAFPYTAFTKTSDDDLTALYAYLMTRAAIAARVPETRLAFPFRLRPLMALWNAVYLRPGPALAEAALSTSTAAQPAATTPARERAALRARGAYLVEGLGHCGACHTERNALGAERVGVDHLGGAWIDGWEAPALTALSHAPLPWSEIDFYDYLRHGHSARHGSAGGPMAPVVQQLAALPDADIRAIASYLASFGVADTAHAEPKANDAARSTGARTAPATARAEAVPLNDATHRLFTTACGACHHDGSGPQLLGQNIALRLSTNLHSARPDNLLRTLLDGIQQPASVEQGFMPGYRDAFDDTQLAQLAAYLRRRFAPDEPAWPDLQAASRRLRAASH